MIKEIKNLILLVIIFIFILIIGRYYFSDINKRNSYRSHNTINEKIDSYTQNIPILNDNTKDIIEYVENSTNNKKRRFNFWQLLESNE